VSSWTPWAGVRGAAAPAHVALALLAAVAALGGCRTTHPAAQPPAAPPQEQTPTPPPSVEAVVPPPPTSPPVENPPPAADPVATPPPCACTQTAPKPRPKRKSKQKTPVQETEPQSVGPPPPMNAVVNAEVGRIDGPLTSILGKNVYSPKGEDLGRVVDLLSDPEGRVRVAIIDFGGFLGVGTRRIAVDWPLLHFIPGDKDKPLTLTVTREKLQSAPEYKDAVSPRVLMAPAAAPDASGADAKK
jgi:PRC-barrel domain protein